MLRITRPLLRPGAMAMGQAGGGGAAAAAPYSLTPIRRFEGTGMHSGFGAEVRGIDLKTCELSAGLIQRIKDDMRDWRVLVFKDQGQVSGKRQVEISARLGELESTFYQHQASPHPHIFRVSNDEREGCTGVGRTGWHVDGTFQESPFKYQTMHFHAAVEGGDTYFVPLFELYQRQKEDVRQRWNRLWMITGRGQKAHPLVYEHPVRKDLTMLFHCGRPFCMGWAEDDDGPEMRARRPHKLHGPTGVQDEITRAADEALDHIGIRMKWTAGDFAINDNVGNAHYACEGTQGDPRKVGLRILHRTTIAGEATPRKPEPDGRTSHVPTYIRSDDEY